ncbi:MAG: hypothetical protein HOY79_04365 [Streptomyces sp.]|nr:hypothetical protein [Streptomyces sp.]NUS15439.1 hypothetical protein [Streptomyces sp.]NUS24103.1 hypothetical protein [Streptomyces sp.]
MSDTNPPRLTGDPLLEFMVAGERRNRARRAGTAEADLPPYPSCPVCGQPVDTQGITAGTADADDRVVTNSPCGHQVGFNLGVTKQKVARVQEILDQEDGDTDTCRPVEVDGEPIRVRGSGELTPEGQEALTALVRAAQTKMQTDAPELIGDLQQRLRLAHKARRAKEHQLDGIRRALCDAGFMEEDDPYGHADLDEVIRQAGELVGPMLREVAAARKFAAEMRDFCSPHGVAADYADRLLEAMDRAKEGRA